MRFFLDIVMYIIVYIMYKRENKEKTICVLSWLVSLIVEFWHVYFNLICKNICIIETFQCLYKISRKFLYEKK